MAKVKIFYFCFWGSWDVGPHLFKKILKNKNMLAVDQVKNL